MCSYALVNRVALVIYSLRIYYQGNTDDQSIWYLFLTFPLLLSKWLEIVSLISFVATHFEKITHFENFFQSVLNLEPT